MNDESIAPSASGKGVVCRYVAASGTSHTDCVVLGRRHWQEVGPVPGETDSYLLVNQPASADVTVTHLRWRYRSFLTGVWRSQSGWVYVADGTDECVRILPDIMDHERPPIEVPVPRGIVPEGIWGLSDDLIFVWGSRRQGGRRRSHHVASFDGSVVRGRGEVRWAEYAPLPNPINDVHGVSAGTVVAVGWRGLIAHASRDGWVTHTPTEEVLSAVHVVSSHEMYAVGEQGSLLQGASAGWAQVGRHPHGAVPLASVAIYRGELYAGAQSFGLLKRSAVTGQLEVFKPKLPARSMSAGASLIITCRNRIAGTHDGVNFSSCAHNKLAELSAATPIGAPAGHGSVITVDEVERVSPQAMQTNPYLENVDPFCRAVIRCMSIADWQDDDMVATCRDLIQDDMPTELKALLYELGENTINLGGWCLEGDEVTYTDFEGDVGELPYDVAIPADFDRAKAIRVCNNVLHESPVWATWKNAASGLDLVTFEEDGIRRWGNLESFVNQLAQEDMLDEDEMDDLDQVRRMLSS